MAVAPNAGDPFDFLGDWDFGGSDAADASFGFRSHVAVALGVAAKSEEGPLDVKAE